MHDWLNSQDVERLNRYREYLEFYDGEQWERQRKLIDIASAVVDGHPLLPKGSEAPP